MIKTSIEKLADSIGFDIGNSDDVVQSDLLNGFCRALTYLPEDRVSMQLCYIADKLTPPSKKILIQLAEFLKQ